MAYNPSLVRKCKLVLDVNIILFSLLEFTVFSQNFAMVNRIWPTAVAGEADSVSFVSASACHIGGPNSINPGQILLVYGTSQEEEPTSQNDLAASRLGKTKANS